MPSIPYEQLFENSARWAASLTAKDPTYFERLASEQRPDYLYIGCSDSRVPANEIMGVEPGDVFVHRNIANVVVHTDLNVGSVIEYAVSHLNVKHIIVCGHYNCGGVKAAMQPRDLGLLNPWLRNIRDVYRMHETELEAITDENQRYERLIEFNVIEQCMNVIKTAAVQRAYLHHGGPIVHGWVFDLHKGKLIDLNIDFEASLKSVQRLYNLEGEVGSR
ncbi:MAG TPA: carbonic anhydrase [Gemmatimonas aurantiaca]|uniref:Carbonic anhydrase n=2 Tax=Gemmatimonas aurantiaca TaxID=173480 RepID=C1A761_GEMAT|nr:carbonic anhydrase [Gemmatimonas aurantiaca]BAH38071.1 carbonic anhydrase [Gemmatimonas aurantiaca T-27]HCT56845.1 carbonic anhydrase [Gemmatimonas aurantiaca]